jgi:hypothetical protein
MAAACLRLIDWKWTAKGRQLGIRADYRVRSTGELRRPTAAA